MNMPKKVRPKKTDLSHLAKSGSQCVGCGRSSNEIMLMRLRTYSRSLCCGACWMKYASCENVNPVNTKCHHEPLDHYNKIVACRMSGCGCPRWVHGLEQDFDRMLAAGVGTSPRLQHCNGFGINLGKCGNMILAGPDGMISRLCSKCERNWVNEVQEGQKEIGALLDLDTTKLPAN